MDLRDALDFLPKNVTTEEEESNDIIHFKLLW